MQFFGEIGFLKPSVSVIPKSAHSDSVTVQTFVHKTGVHVASKRLVVGNTSFYEIPQTFT
jgi:hypothetical protein